MRTLILYLDDFSKHTVWEQICTALGVDSGYSKITLKVADSECDIIDEEGEDNE